MNTPPLSFCDDLDQPLLAVVMDYKWWDKNSRLIMEWLREHGCSADYNGGLLFFPSEAVKLLFLMRWS